MKTWMAATLVATAACGSNNSASHTADAPSGGGGSGVPMVCDIQVSSAQITGSTSASLGGTCTPQLTNQTTLAIDFTAFSDVNNEAMAEISCTITPGVIPQTLGARTSTTGCNLEVDYFNLQGSATNDEWDDNSASSSVKIVLTDLGSASGTIDATIFDSMNAAMTLTGTF